MDTVFDHPSRKIMESYSTYLSGKNILLGITGSVAAIMSAQAARLLMRHGANVIPVITKDGLRMVTEDAMHWATGNKPITEITGETEHIKYAGVDW